MREDLIDRFDATNNQILTGPGPIYTLNNSTGLLQQSGTGPVFHDLWAAPKKNFAPRVGFAYRLFGQQETVLRGGYGPLLRNPPDANLVSGDGGLEHPSRLPNPLRLPRPARVVLQPIPISGARRPLAHRARKQ